ncbi:MAG: protein kinase [Polyangiaceae bacterium]|nr:protein kinase [Polyangiaceae bacterium]
MSKSKREFIVPVGGSLHHHEQKFEVVRVFGMGAMGQVVLARNCNAGNQFAFKLLHPDLASDEYNGYYVQLFEYEARVLGRLDHPGIVNFIQSGLLTFPLGLPYIQMEYTKGETLREILNRKKTLPVEITLDIEEQLFTAVDYTHQTGIVHRDLKPENIMITKSPEGLIRVKMIDFGIFRHKDKDPYKGRTVGTPRYMAPEQYDNNAIVDGKADVYAIGVIGYEMYTGHPPFYADCDGTIPSMQKTFQRKVPSLISTHPNTPIKFSELHEDLLERDPAKRPAETEALEMVRAIYPKPSLPYNVHAQLTDTDIGIEAEVKKIKMDEDVVDRTSPDARISVSMQEIFSQAETELDTAHRIQQAAVAETELDTAHRMQQAGAADTDRANELESGMRTKIPGLSDPPESTSSIVAILNSYSSEHPNSISGANEVDVNDGVRLEPTEERIEPTVVSQSEDRAYDDDNNMVVAQRGDGTLRWGNGEIKLPDPPNRASHPEDNKQNLEEEKPSEKCTIIRSRRDQIEEAEATPAAESSEDLTDEELWAVSEKLADEAARAWRVDLQGEEALLAFRRDYAAEALRELQAAPSEKTIRRLRRWIAEAAADQAVEAAERQGSKGHASGVPEQPQQKTRAQQGSNAPNDASHVESESEGSTDEEVRAVCEALVDETIRALRPLLPNYTSEEQLVDHRELGKIYLEHLRADPSKKTVRAIRAQIAKFAAKLAAERQARKGHASGVPEPPQQEARAQGEDAPATNLPAPSPSNPTSNVESGPSEGPTDEELRAVSEKLADEAIRAWRVDHIGEEELLAFRRDYAVAALHKLQADPSEKTVRAIRAHIAKFAAELAAERQVRKSHADAVPEPPPQKASGQGGKGNTARMRAMPMAPYQMETAAPRQPSQEEPPAAAPASVINHKRTTWTNIAIYSLLLVPLFILALVVFYRLGFDSKSVLPTQPEPPATAPPSIVEPAAHAMTSPSPASSDTEVLPPTPKIAPPVVKHLASKPLPSSSPAPSSSARETVEFQRLVKENR